MLKRLGCFLFGGHDYQPVYQYRLSVPTGKEYYYSDVGTETTSECVCCAKRRTTVKFYSPRTEKQWLMTPPLERHAQVCKLYPKAYRGN